MKESIKRLNLRNMFFGSSTLDIFERDDERISVLYGANGTGKTTIGRAVLYIKKPDDYTEFIDAANFVDSNGNNITITEDEKSNIHVFNEDFIEKEVSFKSIAAQGKVNSIVMFGKNIENSEKIKVLTETTTEDEKSIKNLELDKYNSADDPLSPVLYYDQIKKQASSDWAEEEKELRELTNRAQVREDIINRIISSDTTKKFDLTTYNEKKASFKKLSGKNPQQILDESLKNFKIDIKIDAIKELLSKRFNKPIGSELVNRISKTLSEKSLTRLDEIKESFGDGYCPFCFQDVKVDYVSHIIKEINNIQSIEIKNHIDNLEKFRISNIALNTFHFDQLDYKLTQELNAEVINLNTQIDALNEIIMTKINNPYDSIDVNSIPNIGFKNLYDKAVELEKRRVSFNTDVVNKSKLQQELQELNIQRFAYTVKLSIGNYLKQKKEKETKEAKKLELEKKIQESKNQVNKLNAESKSIGIALNKINEYLGLIFLSKTRLYLEENEGAYIVKRGDQPVPLKKLSNGERNAIALCYFFTRMNENQSEDNMFNVPSLVVLDDPLSSFDHNNKIGIYSFLRRMFGLILKTPESKIVTLTHQIETFFDLHKVTLDLEVKDRTTWLVDKQLQLVNPDKFNVYKRSLNEVFATVKKPASELDVNETENLGNKLRKILEAFSTFIYGCSIEKLSTDPTITENLHTNLIIKDYFIDSMYRISLNTTSHFKDRVYSQIDLLTIGYFDKEGLMRSAKDVLVLMYLLNQKHLKKMLDRYEESFFTDYINNIISTTI